MTGKVDGGLVTSRSRETMTLGSRIKISGTHVVLLGEDPINGADALTRSVGSTLIVVLQVMAGCGADGQSRDLILVGAMSDSRIDLGSWV